ncbi:Vigilin, partial [Lachnellula suecica]
DLQACALTSSDIHSPFLPRTFTMSSAKSAPNGSSASWSAAERLMQNPNESHNPTVEEVPDEEDVTPHPHPASADSILESDADTPSWAPSMSAKAAGKRKEETSSNARTPMLDTQSDEVFPGLGGAPKAPQAAPSPWVSKNGPAANGTSNGVSTNGTSASNSPAANQSAPKVAAPSLAGQVSGMSYTFEPKELPRSATKKPLPDLLRDINKKFRVNLAQTTGEGGSIKIAAGGSRTAESVTRQAFKELGSQINLKTSAKVSIPRSARALIIGKGGANIKALQEASGARIQMPKMEDTPEPVDDDDDMIDVVIEGNPIAVRIAKAELAKKGAERKSTVNTKLRTIPAEFYPFISGEAQALEEAHGVQIRVPTHHTWTSQPPPQLPEQGQAPAFIPAAGDNHVTLAGDRAAVQAARAEIEALTNKLRQELTMQQQSINKGRHQFIIGDRGISVQDFFADTGCGIILPGGAEDDVITIIGTSDQVDEAMDKAMDLAMGMQNSSFDISRHIRGVPRPGEHARNITQYLRDRKQIEKIEKLHQAHIFTPVDYAGGAAPWELYARDGKNAIRAQGEIKNIVMAHPPDRMATVPVDSFFHNHLRNDIIPRVKQDYGVHVVIPSASQPDVLLVFEGEGGQKAEYEVPRGQPTPAEIQAFRQGLEDARKHILDIIGAQAQITSTEIDVPAIFHDKLKRYIKKEQQARSADQIPVRVFNTGTLLTFRGPQPAVESLAAKVNAFVEQAIEDEKERGFTLSFDFPKEYAGQLVGKGASHVNELRERFDVDIKVNDGKVDLKGPKAKAEAAKSHILSLGRQWADTATYTLKVDPTYHSELIGAKGAQINRLQDRYKVQIHFPRQKAFRDDQSNADAASDAGQRKVRPEQSADEVTVKGPTKGADGARDEILSLLQYLKDNSHEATVTVKAGQIPQLIGQRGSGMDEIRTSTGARIDVPNAKNLSPENEVVIKIKGTKSQMAQAKKLIEEKKEVYDQTVKKTLSVDRRHHRALIGSGGSTIRDIVSKAGGSDNPREYIRTVQFPKVEADGNDIKIEGNKEVVDKIIAAINEIVSTLDSQKTDELDIPTDKHRSLIGRGGETKKELEAKFKVALDIPRQGSGQTAVKITGQPDAVAKAKAHLQDLVKEQEGESVSVPLKVHHSIADNGQYFRRLKNEHKVTVDHAGHKVPPKPAAPTNVRANGGAMPLITDDADEAADVHSWKLVDMSESGLDGDIPWILRGPPDNIAKAQAALEAAIEQALQNTTIGYLTLPDPSTYRFVIGTRGSKVDSIRKATGCKITVPRDQAADEAIEIIGSADGVEAARDLILQAVKEGGNAPNGRF